MKKKKSFVIWIMMFIISIIVLLYITFLFYKKEETLLVTMLNTLTVIDIIISIIEFRQKFLLPYINNHRQNYNLKSFVDRDTELKNVLHKINSGEKIIYISGRMGIGKTQFLHKLIDTIYQSEKKLFSSSVYPLYIDLKQGEDLKEAIKVAMQIKDDLNNPDLLKELHKVTKSKSIIILLDNANKRIYLEMEEFIHTLVGIDDNILFIITADSLEKMYQPIEMGNFTEKEVDEIADIQDVYVDKNLCENIIMKSGGLPSIIQLLIKQLKLTGNISNTNEIEIYIEKICGNLTEDQMKLIATIAYYSLVGNKISKYEFEKYYSCCTERNLSSLDANGLIDYNSNNGSILIQEYFAQIIRKNFADNRFEIYESLYSMMEQQEENNKYKLVFLLLSNSKQISDNELIDYLTLLLSEKDYYFLIYLFDLLEDFHKLNQHYNLKNIRTKLIYCYTHSLLELGEYQKAQIFIESSDIWNKDINLKSINSQLEFDFNFDLAEMDHFFGNFEAAIDSYMILKNFDITAEQSVKCEWAIGHCYRHLGDTYSMHIALNCFEKIIEGEQPENNSYYIRAYQSLILIKLFMNDMDYEYEKAFSNMIKFLEKYNKNKISEIKTSRQYAIYQRIVLNDSMSALNTLETALESLEISGIRIKYDYYFEIAETLRHSLIENYSEKNMEKCIDYYNKALTFALKAGDISLKCISQLGIVLCHIFNRKNECDDLENILEICNFCQKKKITYIFNYACKLRDYLLNSIYSDEQQSNSALNKLICMNLFIM